MGGWLQDLGLLWELYRYPLVASVFAGLVLPAVGSLLVLRRNVFLGVAVPQFAYAGLTLCLLLLPWFPWAWRDFLEHGHPPMVLMLGFACAAAGAALVFFARLQARDPGRGGESRLAAGFAFASSLALLFLASGPLGENQARSILRGEVLTLDGHGLVILLVVDALVLAGLLHRRRPFLLFAFDRDGAVAQGFSAAANERSFMLLVGLAIGGGVITLGPILVFGLLFLPPLAARQVAGNLRSFFLHASLAGLLAVLLAWPVSFFLDEPYGPAAVVLGGLLLLPYGLAGAWRRARER